jgi:hypothetical protein
MEDAERARAWAAAASADAPTGTRDEDVADEYEAMVREMNAEANEARAVVEDALELPSVPTRASADARGEMGTDEASAATRAASRRRERAAAE